MKNNSGLLDNPKSGIENLSGHSVGDVKVHPSSDKPAQLQAHAYARRVRTHESMLKAFRCFKISVAMFRL